jgi:hypothetical protein
MPTDDDDRPARPELFISYASPDLARAEALYERLDAAGFVVWFDKARLNPGCDWYREIEAGCEAAHLILPLLTPAWAPSPWTRFETYGHSAVLPLIAEGSPDKVLTPPLTGKQALAFDPLAADEAAWQALSARLRAELPKPRPERAERLFSLPHWRAEYFTGRERELTQICEELHQAPTAVLVQGKVRVLAALGGAGKTTLAREYAHRFWRLYRQIFWLDARLGLENEFARLHDLLFPERAGRDIPPLRKAKEALRALEGSEDRLLVLDNVENEEATRDWIPRTGNCRTLITSRFADWPEAAGVRTIHLHVLSPEHSVAFLLRRTGREGTTGAEAEACATLAEKLGYLPLALEIAGAYIAERKLSFAAYLARYAEAQAALLAENALGSTHYPDSVITTWRASIDAQPPLARALLRLCACLAPTPIPLALFTGQPADVDAFAQAHFAAPPLPAAAAALALEDALIRDLRRYSLVQGWDGESFTVHGLVQAVEWFEAEKAGTAQAEALRAAMLALLLARYPDDGYENPKAWAMAEPLEPHVNAWLARLSEAAEPPEMAALLNASGTALYGRAQFAAAEQRLRRALAIGETSLGQDHPNVGTFLGALGKLLAEVSRPVEAESLLRRSLAISEANFGPFHTRVAKQLNNLTQLLQATNRLTEAEQMIRRALAIDEANFGLDHPEVARDLNNLATLLFVTKRLNEAEPLMRRALSIVETYHGHNSPLITSGLNSLAVLLYSTQRLTEAEPLMRRALVIDEASYGPDHPRLAIRLNNLARLLQATDRRAEAEPLMRRALAIDEASYGPDHPDVAIDLHNLARLLQATDRRAEAEPLMRRHVAIFVSFAKATGHEHPHLNTAVKNYAELLRAMGRSEAEIAAAQNALLAPIGQGIGTPPSPKRP